MEMSEDCGSKTDDKTSSTLKPGDNIKPYVPQGLVAELVKEIYGLNVTRCKELNSYDDKNFHVEISPEYVNPHISHLHPQGYVLKVLNSLDSNKPDYIEGQNELMLFLNGRGFHTPIPVKSVEGKLSTLHKIYKEDSEQWKENNLMERPSGLHIVRLLTFIPGKILYEVPYTPEIFYQMGKYIANMDKAMEDFYHPAYDHHETLWSLESAPRLVEFTYAIRDPDNKKLIQSVVDEFKERVPKNYPTMKKGMLHGDFNEQNIIVREVPGTENQEVPEYEISGVLDYGDTHKSYYIFEVALTITYGMLECKSVDIFDVGGHVLAGYTSVRELTDEEIKLLKVCIAARYAQSLALGEYTYSLDPGNEYLLVTAKNGWPQLRRLWAKDEDEIVARWSEIRSQYKS